MNDLARSLDAVRWTVVALLLAASFVASASAEVWGSGSVRDLWQGFPDGTRWPGKLVQLGVAAAVLFPRTRRAGAALAAVVLAGSIAVRVTSGAWGTVAAPAALLLLAILLAGRRDVVPSTHANPTTSRPRTFPQRLSFALSIAGEAWFVRWLAGGVIYVALVPVAAGIYVRRQRERLTRSEALEIFLLYGIVFLYGVGGLWGFVGHTVLADQVAEGIGWAAGSPFQTELAFYHLGFGVLGLMAIWIRDGLWTAIVVAETIFLYGAAFVHIRDIALHGNFAPFNAGFRVLVLGDIILPTAMLALFIAYRLDRRRNPGPL